MNYTELSAQIQATMENTFPATGTYDGTAVTSKQQIDRFIKSAEQRIYNSVQFPALRKVETLSTTAASPYLDAPTDFLSVESMAVVLSTGAYEFLLNKDPNYIRQAYPTPTSTGAPKVYSVFGPALTGPTPNKELRFILGPTPSAAYPIELHYFYYPESIVTAGTTWLSENFDTVLLYGALVEAAIFMKLSGEETMVYQTRYADALAQAKRLGEGLQKQDAFRSGQVRMPVT
jgi:hypothetical protein